jgi:hypothetical protein
MSIEQIELIKDFTFNLVLFGSALWYGLVEKDYFKYIVLLSLMFILGRII